MIIDERKIYHGKCQTCLTDQTKCKGCRYYKPDWELPSLCSDYAASPRVWNLEDNVKTPKLAVDIVCYDPHYQHLLMINRKHEPLGLAFPGGFVDIGERIRNAAIRELKEETNIDVDLYNINYLFTIDDPNRDPRGHIVSVVWYTYLNMTKNVPTRGDDAKDAMWVDIDNVDFGIINTHREIFEFFIENKKDGWM